ncbi:MAG: hypothetical protein LBV00_02115 [Propionibacteriaceae bacterium]|jgi:hypothetical protein|nr:hypothetical protein [Propionibacteriaceae bacterium]
MKSSSRLLLLLPLVVLLTGCMRLTMGVDIRSDSNIGLTMDIGVTKEVADYLGDSSTDFCDYLQSSGEVPTMPFGFSLTPYTDDQYIGCRIEGASSLAQLNSSSDMLTHADGVYTFALDSSGSLGQLGSAGAMTGTSSAIDFQVGVTFPGEVLSHSGSSVVDGTTVTWYDIADLTASGGLQASGRDGGGSSSLGWVVGIAAAVMVMGLVTVVIVHRRRSAAKARLVAQQNAQAQYSGQYGGIDQAQYSGQWQYGVPGQYAAQSAGQYSGPDQYAAQSAAQYGGQPQGGVPGQYPPGEFPPGQYVPGQYAPGQQVDPTSGSYTARPTYPAQATGQGLPTAPSPAPNPFDAVGQAGAAAESPWAPPATTSDGAEPRFPNSGVS